MTHPLLAGARRLLSAPPTATLAMVFDNLSAADHAAVYIAAVAVTGRTDVRAAFAEAARESDAALAAMFDAVAEGIGEQGEQWSCEHK